MANPQALWTNSFLGTIVLAGCVGLASVAAGAPPQTAGGAEKAAAGNKEVVNEKAQTRSAGAADANVKSDSEKNNPNAKAAPPPEKGGPKTRGAGPYRCGIHVDNHTPWIIRTYVDGGYVGAVNRYGDIAGITGNGPTTLYAVALFDDGSAKYWGPHVFNCAAGDIYTWRLQ
jgi:hypothetical protein